MVNCLSYFTSKDVAKQNPMLDIWGWFRSSILEILVVTLNHYSMLVLKYLCPLQ